MKRYVKNSSIKKIQILRSSISGSFYAEIIHEPAKSVAIEKTEEFLREISIVVNRSWGRFPTDYLEKNILGSFLLLLLRNNKDELIGFTLIDRFKLDSDYIYSFGITVVVPKYQGLGIMKLMAFILIKRIFVNNLIRLRLSLNFVFYTPNLKTIVALSHYAKFIYPNPLDINTKTGKIPTCDEATWIIVKKFLEITGFDFLDYNRNGSVLNGFYNDKPNLIQKNEFINEKSNKKLWLFKKNYLKNGNEIIVYAIINLVSIIKYVLFKKAIIYDKEI